MRILLIEDQPVHAAQLRQCLQAAGFFVDVSATSTDAHDQIQANTYDFLLLSLLLRKDDGFRLLYELRCAGVASPVLTVVGARNIDDRIRCLELGADGYLTRPIHPGELIAHIRALLRRTRQADSVIRVHDLEVDTNSHSVQRAGRHIRLTQREYKLLEFLAKNRGKVCSRSMIWEQVYGDPEASRSNVIDVYIRFLRAKIDRDFDKQLILTRWGRGYLLRDDAVSAAG